jgi:hypothetical protein
MAQLSTSPINPQTHIKDNSRKKQKIQIVSFSFQATLGQNHDVRAPARNLHGTEFSKFCRAIVAIFYSILISMPAGQEYKPEEQVGAPTVTSASFE